MGILDDLEQNARHTDLIIALDVAESFSSTDQYLPVEVIINNATDKVRQIKSVIIEVQATDNKGGYEMGMSNIIQISNTTSSQEMYSMDTLIIGSTILDEEFSVEPHNSRKVDVNFKIKDDLAAQNIDKSNFTKYNYVVVAKADVEGLITKPSVRQKIMPNETVD